MCADSHSTADTGMSQADIDAALAGADPGAQDSPSDATAQPPSAGLSQADIDAAMAGAADAPSTSATAGLSQADIDAALAGVAGGDDAPAAAPAPASEPTTSAVDGLSQADIDAAFGNAGLEAPPVAGEPATEAPAAPEARTDSEGRQFDAAAAAMAAAIAEEKAAAVMAQPSAAEVDATPFELPDLEGGPGDAIDRRGIELLNDVKLRVTIELGRTRMAVEDVLRLNDGSIVELDKLAGDPVDIMVNDRLVARGEVLVLNETFGVRINEIVAPDELARAGRSAIPAL